MVLFFEPMLNRIINRVIQFDASTKTRLAHLDGKCLYLQISDLKLDFDIFFTKTNIRLQSKKIGTQNEAQVQVKAPVAALIAFAGSKKIKEATERGLIIEGDIELAHEIQNFVMGLDIDWEEMLSRYTGDIFAHAFFQGIRKAENKKRGIIENLSFSARNFLQEEQRLLPTAIEVEYFNHSVDELRNEVDRLEMRVQLILANHKKNIDKKRYVHENNVGKDLK